jgi:hypothetical protein
MHSAADTGSWRISPLYEIDIPWPNNSTSVSGAALEDGRCGYSKAKIRLGNIIAPSEGKSEIVLLCRRFGAPASVGAPRNGALLIGDLRALRSDAMLQTSTIEAIPLQLSVVEFEDARELALKMLGESLVPVPGVVAGVAALARTSEREGEVARERPDTPRCEGEVRWLHRRG